MGCIIAIRLRQTLTQIERKHEQLVSSARIDGLTGLLNRPGFDAVAAEAFEETRRAGQPVSAVLCDIDAFRVLIPEEAAPQFLDDAAPRNGMMPPPNSEMMSPPITE
jgi:predicted signal transduction protein with EAL and GGDEF domain